MQTKETPKILDHLPAIVEYVKQHGRLEGSCDPQLLSLRTIHRAIKRGGQYFRQDVYDAIQEAFAYYRKTNVHPSDDPECRQTALEQFKAGLKAGNSYSVEQTYTEDGKPWKKIFRKAGLLAWQFEVVFPKKVFTEQALLVVTSNQLKDIATSSEFTEGERSKVLTWLSKFIDKSVEDLQKQGLSTKMFDTMEK